METRLARLPVEARRVLRAASVFGEVCWEGGVIARLGGTLTEMLVGGTMNATIVGEWLGRLIEQELLTVRPSGRFPEERELAFRHALLREGAYATLTEKDLRLGHRLAGEWIEQRGEGDPMVLAGHFERGGEGARAGLLPEGGGAGAPRPRRGRATLARVEQGLACAPPEALRLALLGVRCVAASQSMHLLVAGLASADELAVIQQLREVEVEPEALDRLALPFFVAIGLLDLLGRVEEATELEARFYKVIRPARDRTPLARCWWNLLLAFRAGFAHEDPRLGLVRGEENQAIFDLIGGERSFLNTRLFQSVNRFFLGAFASAEETLRGLAAADTSLGIGSSVRRFLLAWLLADRGSRASWPSTGARIASRSRRGAADGCSRRCSAARATRAGPSARSTSRSR